MLWWFTAAWFVAGVATGFLMSWFRSRTGK
jgi:hypothetical protein